MRLCDLRNICMDLLRPFEEPDLRIIMPNPLSSETDEEMSASERRRYKAYTVMQRSGFQHTEYVKIMVHLCRVELAISFAFLVHGLGCPGYPDEAEYQSTCHMNTVAALVGLLTGALGLGAVHKYRWRTMLMMWLVCCIISAVGNLLAVITTGIWLDHLSKMKDRTGLVNGLSGFMLLSSVAVGVCFILTAVMICHYWNSNSPKYQPVGKVAKRTRLRRRLSRMKSGEKKEPRSGSKGYHVV
ncbi:hypothetical protein KIN20_022588 [Parelaphostrongylus tenuis]|uniref:Uncharacterized protein n=1 Tax=Parelaphostrongylus tenuis TaxID=148309 RepID=A0AAD5NBP7_PARTN|nr:hypothetical protein KIN20_022588 [Parelaphostrongylus tenuis]